MAASIEHNIIDYFRRALVKYLSLDDSQARVGVVKSRDANWQGKPFYLVVPGASRPDGKGKGAQEGGGVVIRRQEVSVYIYIQLLMDQYSQTGQMLTNYTVGTLDLFEQLRALFACTWFGDGTTFTLIEPVWLEREGQTTIEDADLGIACREFVFAVLYGADLPQSITITLSDVATDI